MTKIIMKTTKIMAVITLVISSIWEFGCLFGKAGIPKDELDWIIFSVINLTIVFDYLVLRLNEEYDKMIYLRKELGED